MTASVRQPSFEAASDEVGCQSVILRSPPGNLRRQRLFLLQGASGGRPQRPGNQSRSHAFLEVFPIRQFPRESPAATGSAAINRQAQERSRFAELTFDQVAARGNIKTELFCAETVEDETSLWKNEEN
jgi:hypothetical protein